MFSRKELVGFVVEDNQKRREAYPRMVRERKLTQTQADERIAMMQAIYRILINAPEELFGKGE